MVIRVFSFVLLNFYHYLIQLLKLVHHDHDVIELARVVDRGIRESHMIDVSQLVIEKDKSVVGVFADNVVVDYDGNLFDACSYAATAAITYINNSKMGIGLMINQHLLKVKKLLYQYTTIPVSVTMGKIGKHIIVDPNGDEWASMDARITITTDSDGNICALQKGGSDGFTLEEINQCGEISVNVGAKIREKLKASSKGKSIKWQEAKKSLKGLGARYGIKLRKQYTKIHFQL